MNRDSLRGYLLGCVLLMVVSGSAVHAAAPYKDEAVPSLPAGTTSDWWSQVQRDLTAREYHASATGDGLQAPNRVQGFRTYFDADGIRVVERGAESRELLRLRLSEFGRGKALTRVAAGTVSSRQQRVEITRPGLIEWYENRAEGLEQGFTLTQRPPGHGDLLLTVQVVGATPHVVGEAIELRTESGRTLRYGKLKILDTEQHELPGRIEGEHSGILTLSGAAGDDGQRPA